MIYVAKTKALSSCMVTVQLVCAIDFAYARNRLSHDAAHIIKLSSSLKEEQIFLTKNTLWLTFQHLSMANSRQGPLGNFEYLYLWLNF